VKKRKSRCKAPSQWTAEGGYFFSQKSQRSGCPRKSSPRERVAGDKKVFVPKKGGSGKTRVKFSKGPHWGAKQTHIAGRPKKKCPHPKGPKTLVVQAPTKYKTTPCAKRVVAQNWGMASKPGKKSSKKAVSKKARGKSHGKMGAEKFPKTLFCRKNPGKKNSKKVLTPSTPACPEGPRKKGVAHPN